jgi:hypothetical protein
MRQRRIEIAAVVSKYAMDERARTLLLIETPARCRASSQIRTEKLAANSKALHELGNAIILGNCCYVWRVWRNSSKDESIAGAWAALLRQDKRQFLIRTLSRAF